MQVPVTIQTYSGYKADERPSSFILGEQTFRVMEILDRWYGVDANYFKVAADDSRVYLLRHDLNADQWELDAE
ncbi:hypothetical protein [Geotalea toluenoxydans]